MGKKIQNISHMQSITLKHAHDSHRHASTNPLHLPSASTRQIIFSATKNPVSVILQSIMDKVDEVFTPYLGEHGVEKAIDSEIAMSPQTAAGHIISFANHLIGKAEIAQLDLPLEEQQTREQLFRHVQRGIEQGFGQARTILEGIDALHGETLDTVANTYALVQQGLVELSAMLGLFPIEGTGA